MIAAEVALAGACGALARYLLDGWIQERARGILPWGTLVINVSGSLVLGILTGLALHHGLGSTPRVVFGTGFCGGFTTFSTFAYETMALLEDGAVAAAARNVAANAALALVFAGAGIALASIR